MNNIEETLWNYIDGNCTPAEEQTIASLIKTDETYKAKYQELLALNLTIADMELDEPSMAFTYNVMEGIRTEQALNPLKSAINKKIITGISIFFLVTITALLVFTLSNINLSAASSSVNVPSNIKVPDMSSYITKPVKLGFMFFDIVIGLFLFDTYLRRKGTVKPI